MDVQKIEKTILRFWENDKTFEKSIENRKHARDFVFYEGPPTANGKPGIHHVLARSFKDIICRYKTMRGFRVLRKAGWDTHGLPVEIEVENRLGLKNKRDIEKYGIAKFNKKCKESVWRYKSDWEDLTKKIGFWLDMGAPYITYERHYMETLWCIIKQVWEKGFLYQDFKVVPYCARCGTGLSSHEVALGYKNIKESSVYIKFEIRPFDKAQVVPSKVEGRNSKSETNLKFKTRKTKTFLLVWTTTPWTLPGNVAIAVHPDIEYVEVEHKGENLILARERLGVLDGTHKIVKEFNGEELLGLEYEPLFNFVKPDKKAYFIIPGDFVSVEEGTGLVHIAPAFGEEDLEAGKENDLPVLIGVGEDGKFKDEILPWKGEWVKDADPKIIQELLTRKVLYKEEPYEHDYPYCWRCDLPLLYLAKKSWFIKMSKVRKDLLRNNKRINWVPSHIQEGRFGEWLREVKDWAFSRERYWGTPLPIWQCQIGKMQNAQGKSLRHGTGHAKYKRQKPCNNKIVIGSIRDLLSQKFSTNQYFTLRHGEADSNIKEYVSSSPEPKPNHLTAKGKKDIKKLASRLKKEKIDIIITSPLTRTKETAKIIADLLRIPVEVDYGLREIETGLLNGENIDDYRNFFGSTSALFSKKKPLGGENLKDIQLRMLRTIRLIDKKYKNKKILLVSHGDPLWMLGGLMEGMGQEEFIKHKSHLSSKTAGFKKLSYTVLPYNEECEPDLHRPYIDKVEFFCKKCNGNMKRVPDLIDVWFDSGAMPIAQSGKPDFAQIKNLKLKIKNHDILFPADFICEAMDQTRGWFYTLLSISTLLGLGSSFKNVISLGLVLDKKGEKMSKSKGNVVDPWEMISKYGADATRWYFFTVNQPGEVKKFDEADIAERQRRFIGTLYNTYCFFETYVSKKQFSISPSTSSGFRAESRDPSTSSGFRAESRDNFQFPKHVLDRWIVSRLNELIYLVTNDLDDYDVTLAAREIEKFVDDLSNWYVRRSRRRFQRPENKEEKMQAEQTLAFVMLEFSKITAPFIPFLSEEIYRGIRCQVPLRQSSGQAGIRNKRALDSVHLEDWPKAQKNLINQELNKQMDIARRIVALGLKARAREGIRVRQPLAVLELRIKNYAAGGEPRHRRELRDFVDLIKEELNVKDIKRVKETSKGFIREKEGGIEVALDTCITPQLKEEGSMREVVRNIQDMRKEAGYQPIWICELRLFASAPLGGILKRWGEFIQHETNTVSIVWGERTKKIFDIEKKISINGEVLEIGIRRV